MSVVRSSWAIKLQKEINERPQCNKLLHPIDQLFFRLKLTLRSKSTVLLGSTNDTNIDKLESH
jgi:hypothetical protein